MVCASLLLGQGWRSYVIVRLFVLSVSRTTHERFNGCGQGWWSYVIVRLFVLSVSRITHERFNGCQPNIIVVGNG